jgi:acyl-ACP thioesterase
LIPELVDPPADPMARTFSATHRCRLGDVTPAGRARLDALARWLQDVANDDAFDAELPSAMWWVVRRTTIAAHRFPVLREDVTLTTWCSGTGGRWAERRTSITGDRGAQVEAASLWVHIDPKTLRPARLPDAFSDLYAPAAAGRVVRARLNHPEPAATTERRPWVLRAADFDVLEHVNNAVYLAALEDLLDARARPMVVDVEYREGVRVGEEATLAIDASTDNGLFVWILADGGVAASVRCDML